MKSHKMLVSSTVAVLGLAISSMAAAVTISPANASFNASGTINVTASIAAKVQCNVVFSGVTSANGATAQINSVSISGSNSLCGQTMPKNLPWTLTPTSTTSGQVSNVSFSTLGIVNCGPGTIVASWSNATNTLSAINQPLSGSCTINSLSVSPTPAFTLNP